MIDQVAGIISRYNMFLPGARVGVAVSGGADSVCLLHVLYELRSRWNLQLSVIHLNHLLRAADSDRDEQFVRDLSLSLDLPVFCERVDVAAQAAAGQGNLEQAARDARRGVFFRVLASQQVDRIALAHTRDDQAETVLFRFLRGAYTTGLAGMHPVTPDGLVRPFLYIGRDDTRLYMREHNISWRDDPSNNDPRFARNRIRHHLLPELVSEWNPNLPALLAQHAVLAAEDEEYWDSEVDRLAGSLLTRSDRVVIAHIPPFESLSNALARRVIRLAFQLVKGDLREIDYRHIDAALNLVRQPGGHQRLQVPGVDLLRSFDWVRFAPPAHSPAGRDFDLPLTVPGTFALPGSMQSLSLELVDLQAVNPVSSELAHVTLGTDLDWDSIRAASGAGSHPAGLILRNWRPGDAYQPAGNQHPLKIKTLFHEARVPLWDRRNWPVITCGGCIIWSRKFGPANDLAARPDSRIVLRVSRR